MANTERRRILRSKLYGRTKREQIEAEQSYGQRIDILPLDIRRELRKFICPYSLRIVEDQDYNIIIYFPDISHNILIEYYQANRINLRELLLTLFRPDLMGENVYCEEMNFTDRWYFDRHTLRVASVYPDEEFNLPIRPVLIDALTYVYNSIHVDSEYIEEYVEL